MKPIPFRSLAAAILAAVATLTPMLGPDAASAGAFVEQLVARAIDVSGSENAGRIDIYIERWSSDAELENLRMPLAERAPGKLLDALQQQRRRAGVVLMPGVQGLGARARTRTPRNLWFAREVVTPLGRRIILASDEHLGIGEPARDARRSTQEFNLLEIRFDGAGTGVGKLADSGQVTYSQVGRTLEVAQYPTKPARLVEVRSAKP
jgi:hypothetical protein